MNIDFIPSKYQEAIFHFILFGKGNAVIQAVAGSGKTTTVVRALGIIPADKKILYLAFNKDVVAQVKDKHGNIRNTDFRTLHGYGMSIISGLNANVVVDNYKYSNMLKSIYDFLSGTKTKIKEYNFSPQQLETIKRFRLEDPLPEHDNEFRFRDRISDLCNLGRMMLVESIEELEDIAYRYDIDCFNRECELALLLIGLGECCTDSVDYTDMIYLPVKFNLYGKQYDWVFVDECQDLNIAQRTLMFRAIKDDGRFAAVGDKNQAIYGFAGADVAGFNKLVSHQDTIQLPLSVCYRCDESIIKLAKTIVPHIEFFEKNGPGIVNDNASQQEIIDGDMVLCRQTYPLVKLCFDYLKKGIKASVRGKDIGKNIIELIIKTKKIELDDIYAKLYGDLEKTKKRVIRRHGLTDAEAQKHEEFKSHQEKIEIIELLGADSSNSNEIITKLEKVFSDVEKNGIHLSTIHKAKGLESNRVFIIHQEMLFSKNTKSKKISEIQQEQEQNVEYVAYTRAKHYLGFVTDFNAYAGKDKNSKAKSVGIIKESKFVGVPGQTMFVDLELTEKISMSTKYGDTFLCKFTDINGNVFTKFGKPISEFLEEENNGKKICCAITIKEHRSFGDSKETSLSKLEYGLHEKAYEEKRVERQKELNNNRLKKEKEKEEKRQAKEAEKYMKEEADKKKSAKKNKKPEIKKNKRAEIRKLNISQSKINFDSLNLN